MCLQYSKPQSDSEAHGDPKVGASSSELDNRFLSVRENGRRLAKTGFAPVLPSGIGPASPALQAGAITRSATGAKSWPRQDQGRLCPATGIVDYLIVKDHPRPSPEWLPRISCALADFIIRVDLSRSRRRPSLPCRVCVSPEMKKAAEVDFTWAAFPRTYEKRLLGSAPQAGGERLENL